MPSNIPPDIVKKTRKEKEGILEQMNQKNKMKKNRNNNHRGFKWWNWKVLTGGLLAVLLLIFFLYPSSADVRIFPRQVFIDLDRQLQAQASPAENLGFETMVLNDEVSQAVNLDQAEEVSTAASGRVVVYNEYSSESQRFVANTRFESPDGLIYRAKQPIEIPGYTQEDGQIVPGSVEVEVFAEQPGQEYNIGITDFTVPGLAGTEQFDDFYARSITEMTDGFEGQAYTLSQDRFDQLTEEMLTELETKMTRSAKAQLPNGFVLYDQLVFFQPLLDEQPPFAETQRVNMEVAGEVTAVIFNSQSLQNAILDDQEELANQDVYIHNLNDLDLTFESDDFDPQTAEDIAFEIAGNARVVWQLNEEQLSERLAGQSRSEVVQLAADDSSIEQLQFDLQPFWRRSLPKESKLNIDIIVGSQEN